MKFAFKIPTLNPIRLQPQSIEEDDELLQAIANDINAHDDTWELSEYPDSEALENYWAEVAAEESKDSRSL